MKHRGDDASPFVFLDPHGKRWTRLRIALLIGGILLFVGIVLFVQALFVRPELQLPASVRKLKGQLRALQQQNAASQTAANAEAWQKFFPKTQAEQARLAKLREQLHTKPRKFSEIRLGFYVDWDPNSYNSLETHANQLTHVCPEWMSLVDVNGTLRVEEDVRVEHLAASKGLVLMPLLNNLVENVWQPEAVENLANGAAEHRNKFIVDLLKALDDAKAGGVVVDWEQLDPAYQKQVTDLLIKMSDALHAVDKELWLMVPMGDEFGVYDLESLADHADHFVAMLYDETTDTDKPGPIASQDWFEGWLSGTAGYGEPQQWIGAIGTYGYDWSTANKAAESISFCDAMSRASYAGIAKIETAAPSFNPFFSYQEPKGDHTICFLDAITFLNQLRAVRWSQL